MKTVSVGVTEDGVKVLESFMKRLNENVKHKVLKGLVVEHALQKLGDEDIPVLQEKHFTPSAKLTLLVAEYNRNNPGAQLDEEGYLGMLLDKHKRGLKTVNKDAKA